MASEPLTSSSQESRQFGVLDLAALVAPTVVLVAGFFLNPTATLRSYLWIYLFILSIPVGSLAILMLQYLTGGAWGVILRRPLEAATRTLPLMAVLFLPIAYSAHRIFPWAATDAHVPYPRSLYLNLTFFWIRAAIYFGAWTLLSWQLNRWSAMQDESNPPGFERRFRLLAGPGLAILGITVTFASIDWAMSLEQDWFSSIYGALFGMGMVLSAFTFGIIVILKHADQPPYRAVLVSGHLRDLGNLLLAFVMIWGYLAISQFLLIWIANLKEEVPYYIARSHGGWQYLITFVVLAIFVFPFIVLLTRDGKRNARMLGLVATVILFARLFELYWLIAPGRPVEGQTVFWIDLITPFALGGPCLAYFIKELHRRPMLPTLVDASVQEDHHG